MRFFGLIRKKKKGSTAKESVDTEEETTTQNVASTSSSYKGTQSYLRGLVKVRYLHVSSPLVTMEEVAEPATVATAVETPGSLLSALNIVTGDHDESLEVFYGHKEMVTKPCTKDNSTKEPEARQLFCESSHDGGVEEYKDNSQDQLHFVNRVSPVAGIDPCVGANNDGEYNTKKGQDEEPFDIEAVFHGREDPTILDIEKTESQEPDDDDDDNEPPPPPPPLPELVARKLLNAFNCQSDTTTGTNNRLGIASFYDGMCGPGLHKQNTNRPYFNKDFTMAFLKEATHDGVPLLYHLSNTNGTEAWTGRSVTMLIRLGNSHGARICQPRLTWTSMGGGQSEAVTMEIDLLDIQNVMDSVDSEDIRDDVVLEDMCFFSITTSKGNVHLFEARSYEERDRVVNGIRNLIARLAFHLVAGDAIISSELYSEDYGQFSGELPSLRTSAQAMNQISHAFLESGST